MIELAQKLWPPIRSYHECGPYAFLITASLYAARSVVLGITSTSLTGLRRAHLSRLLTVILIPFLLRLARAHLIPPVILAEAARTNPTFLISLSRSAISVFGAQIPRLATQACRAGSASLVGATVVVWQSWVSYSAEP